MAFLDRLSKGVSKAANQAKFEADKMVRVNKLSSEATEMARQVETLTADVGRKALELISAGQIDAPELSELAAEVRTLEASLAAKRAELEEAKLARFEEEAEEAAPVVPAAPARTSAVETAPVLHCTNCGAELQPGAKFCPSCGQKVEG